jgi:hypothetical protein
MNSVMVHMGTKERHCTSGTEGACTDVEAGETKGGAKKLKRKTEHFGDVVTTSDGLGHATW